MTKEELKELIRKFDYSNRMIHWSYRFWHKVFEKLGVKD